MNCPYCGTDAGSSIVCPKCNTALYNTAPTAPQGPTVPLQKPKKNLKPIIMAAAAAVAVILLVVIIAALAGGKKYFKKSDYKDSEKRVAQIYEDTLNVLEEDDGEHTDKILTQSAEILDNGFDKKDIDTMAKVLIKSGIWEQVEEGVEEYLDMGDNFKVSIEDKETSKDDDEIEELLSEIEEIDEDAFIEYIADDDNFEMTEEEAREFIKAANSYLKKLSEANVEEIAYLELEIETDDDYNYAESFAFKIDGKWIVPLPYYLSSFNKYISKSKDVALTTAAEDFYSAVKVFMADPDSSAPYDTTGTIDIYVEGGKLQIDFSGDIADYSDQILEYAGVDSGASMGKTDKHYRITISEGPSFNMEEISE